MSVVAEIEAVLGGSDVMRDAHVMAVTVAAQKLAMVRVSVHIVANTDEIEGDGCLTPEHLREFANDIRGYKTFNQDGVWMVHMLQVAFLLAMGAATVNDRAEVVAWFDAKAESLAGAVEARAAAIEALP